MVHAQEKRAAACCSDSHPATFPVCFSGESADFLAIPRSVPQSEVSPFHTAFLWPFGMVGEEARSEVTLDLRHRMPPQKN